MTLILTLVWCTATAQFTIPAVSPPKCVAGCDDEGERSPPPQTQPAPEETPAQRAAREAAAEEARRRAELADRAARQAAEESRGDLERLEHRGARLRDEVRRFDAFEQQAGDRERVRPEVRGALAPVKPVAQPTPAFSLEEYIRRLNAEERARQRGLHSTPPPPLGTVAPLSTRPDPATIPAERVGLLTGFARQQAEARAIADELAWKELWRMPEKYVPGVKLVRALIEDGKKLFEGLRGMNQRILEGTFSQAHQVAWTVGSETTSASVTNEDNTALMQQQHRDATRTTNGLLRDKLRGTLLGGALERAGDWPSGGATP